MYSVVENFGVENSAGEFYVVEHFVVSVLVVEQHVVDPLSGVVDLAVAPVGQSPKLSERDGRFVGG